MSSNPANPKRSNSRSSSSNAKEKINVTEKQNEKIEESLDESEKLEVKELLGHLDEEIVEGRLKLPDSSSSSRPPSVSSNKTAKTAKSQSKASKSSRVSVSQKSIKEVATKPKKSKSLSPEDEEKKDVREFFNNIEDEIIEGVLNDPSKSKNAKSSEAVSEKEEEVRSEKHESSQRCKSIQSSAKVNKKNISEDSEEEIRKEVNELLGHLSEELVVGQIKLPNGANDKLETASESIEKNSEKSYRSDSKVSLEKNKKNKDRDISNLNSEDEIKKEVKEMLGNPQDELVEGILRLPDGRHPIISSSAHESEVLSQKESRKSRKTESKVSRASSKSGLNSTEQEIQELLDNLSDELEIGILQAPR